VRVLTILLAAQARVLEPTQTLEQALEQALAAAHRAF
jgi:hypothetical protein